MEGTLSSAKNLFPQEKHFQSKVNQVFSCKEPEFFLTRDNGNAYKLRNRNILIEVRCFSSPQLLHRSSVKLRA